MKSNKKLNRKSLSKTAIATIVMILITSVAFAFVYAKYTSNAQPESISGRPGAFSLVMDSEDEPIIKVNFANDGEPGSQLGYSESYREYEFEVTSTGAEVAVDYSLELIFSEKLTDLINKARENRYQEGICFDFEVYEQDANDSKKFNLLNGTTSESDGKMTWRYAPTAPIPPLTNPNGSTSGNVKYRVCMTVYNNTTMPSAGNTEDAIISIDGIEIKVTSAQHSPK